VKHNGNLTVKRIKPAKLIIAVAKLAMISCFSIIKWNIPFTYNNSRGKVPQF
jgi:hypothetical protein